MPAGKGLAIPAIAETILAAVVAHYATAGGVSLPSRRIIAPGSARAIAWDCDQLVVCLAGVGTGAAPGQGGGAARVGNPVSLAGVRHAVFAVQLVRCAPESADGGTAPPAADVTAAGLALMRDAGLLSQALVEACTAVKASIDGSAVAGAIEMVGPAGGLAAVEGSIAVTSGFLS